MKKGGKKGKKKNGRLKMDKSTFYKFTLNVKHLFYKTLTHYSTETHYPIYTF